MPNVFWLAVLLAVAAIVFGRVLSRPGDTAPTTDRLPAYTIAVIGSAVLVALLAWLVPDLPKGLAAVGGTTIGLLVALLTDWRSRPGPAATGARLGATVLGIAACLLFGPDPVIQSYALAALAAVLCAAHAMAVIYDREDLGTGAKAALSLLALGALSWVDRSQALIGAAHWLMIAAAATAGLAAAGWAWPTTRWVPPAAAGLAGLLALLALSPSGIAHPIPAYALGFALAIGLSLIPPAHAQRSGTAMLVTIGGAAVLLLSLRLGGVGALGLTGIGMIGIAGLSPAHWATTLIGVAGARIVLQTFLVRTNLNDIGIDLTHTYGFAGLILGLFWPLTLAALHPRLGNRSSLLLPFGWSLVLTPVLVGFILHVEPLATFIMGLLALAMTLGLLRPAGNKVAADLSLPLLGLALATTLLSSAWLVSMINATRWVRSLTLLVALAAVTAFGLALQAHSGRAAPAQDD